MSDRQKPNLERKTFHRGDRQEWAVIGQWGGLSFWVEKTTEENRYYGGVENHYNERARPGYLGGSAYHNDCHVNDGECWHDGTSLWAREHWIPDILPRGEEAIFCALEYHYEERMAPEVTP